MNIWNSVWKKQEKGWHQQQEFMAAMHGNSETGAGESIKRGIILQQIKFTINI